MSKSGEVLIDIPPEAPAQPEDTQTSQSNKPMVLLRKFLRKEKLLSLRRREFDPEDQDYENVDEVTKYGFGPLAKLEYRNYPSYNVFNVKGKTVLRAWAREKVLSGGFFPLNWFGFQRRSLLICVTTGRNDEEPLLFIQTEPYWNSRICPFGSAKVFLSTGEPLGILHLTCPKGHQRKHIIAEKSGARLNILFGLADLGHVGWTDPNMMVLLENETHVHVQVANIRRTTTFTLTTPQQLKSSWKALLVAYMIYLDLKHYVRIRESKEKNPVPKTDESDTKYESKKQ